MKDVTEIVARLGHDPAARDELAVLAVQRMQDLGRRMLRRNRKLRRWEESDDLSQGAAVRLLEALREARPASETEFLLLCGEMVRRQLLDRWRYFYGRDGKGGRATRYRTPPPGVAREVPELGKTLDVTASLEAQEFLDTLPDRQRKVVELRFMLGLGVEEVAARLGVDARTIRRDWAKVSEALVRAYGDGGSDS